MQITVEALPAWVKFAFLLTALDLVLGAIVSIAQKRLSSQLGYEGVMRRLAFIALLLFVWAVLHWVQTQDFALLFSGTISLVVVAYELASIKRHLVKLGVPCKYLRFIPDDRAFTDGVNKDGEKTNTRD